MRLDKASSELIAELGRAPTVVELAHRTETTIEQVLEGLPAATARHAVSLEQPLRERDDPDAHGLEIAVEDDGFASAEDAAVVDGLLRELPQRERLVLHLRFREDLTQSEIGELIGTSQMHVSRLIRTALGQLHANASRNPARRRL
jgi:RNA polymerase sigma-B factor